MDKYWKVKYCARSNIPDRYDIVAYSGSVFIRSETIDKAIERVKKQLEYFNATEGFDITICSAKELFTEEKNEMQDIQK